jgi:hypothetical protein
MNQNNSYTTLRGAAIDLTGLDADERDLVEQLVTRHQSAPDWSDYTNYYMTTIGNFYLARGLKHRQITELPVWKIGQDLRGRLMIAAGDAIAPDADYRDRLSDLIRSAFPTQRAFCEATGLSEDLVSHVLSKRKHLSIDNLSEALRRIGYKLDIVPAEKA